MDRQRQYGETLAQQLRLCFIWDRLFGRRNEGKTKARCAVRRVSRRPARSWQARALLMTGAPSPFSWSAKSLHCPSLLVSISLSLSHPAAAAAAVTRRACTHPQTKKQVTGGRGNTNFLFSHSISPSCAAARPRRRSCWRLSWCVVVCTLDWGGRKEQEGEGKKEQEGGEKRPSSALQLFPLTRDKTNGHPPPRPGPTRRLDSRRRATFRPARRTGSAPRAPLWRERKNPSARPSSKTANSRRESSGLARRLGPPSFSLSRRRRPLLATAPWSHTPAPLTRHTKE